MFRRIVLPPSSGWKSKPNMQQVNINPPAEQYKFTDVSEEGNAPIFMVKSKPNKKLVRREQ
jgi:hypothetical protein